MNRRMAASLLALALAVTLVTVANQKSAPFTVLTPGPTYNVLGAADGKQILEIKGHKIYPDTGALRLVTVYVTPAEAKIGLWRAVLDWINPNVTLLPHDALYGKHETDQSSQQQSAVQMSTSQDDATAAALKAVGIKYRNVVAVADVDPKGPAAKVLQSDDVINSVDGVATTDAAGLVTAIQKHKIGSKLRISITRLGKDSTVTITTGKSTVDPTKSRIGISPGEKYVFPFTVNVTLPNVGGPSAGMMFALSIYDLLTPGSLTGGNVIAGSGEISAAGVVSPIGGIGQKLFSAERDGAKLFLVAAENCAEATKAHIDTKKMRLVKVHTLDDAITAVNTWRENPNAALTGCS